jgi:hypothetical protein
MKCYTKTSVVIDGSPLKMKGFGPTEIQDLYLIVKA